jgi:drug/metabolite transporter, DME family
LFGVAPVATGLVARVADRSPLGYGWFASTACAVAGCTLLLLPDHAGRTDAVGVVLAIVAAACYPVYTVSAKRPRPPPGRSLWPNRWSRRPRASACCTST